MCAYTSRPGWDSVGLRVAAQGRVLLPTKTSRMFFHSFGVSLSFTRTCSQVFTTSLVNPLFLIFGLLSFVFGESRVACAQPSCLDFLAVVVFVSLSLGAGPISRRQSRRGGSGGVGTPSEVRVSGGLFLVLACVGHGLGY